MHTGNKREGRGAALIKTICWMLPMGSVLHGTDSEKSDLDLLVDRTPTTSLFDIVRIKFELEELLGVEVDILTPESLHENFRDIVLAEAVPV